MKKIIFIIFGFLLLFVQHYIAAIPLHIQYVVFFIGILVLGVPHGAADLLVATKNADETKARFSKQKFFITYLGRLVLFACILFFFPVIGNILFIVFAAYHFGETDLNQFKTNTISGKLFVIAYGLLILSVIIMHHFDEVKTIYMMFESGVDNQPIINWVSENRYDLLYINAAFFFLTCFFYFSQNNQPQHADTGQFLVRLACILFILFNLPLMLGFTFYFVIWHSMLSLDSIIHYLRQHNHVSYPVIIKQIILYSFLAILGIGVFSLTGSMFVNSSAIAGYIFIGLAVLTAPHMEIMYNMYGAMRTKREPILS